MRERDLFTNGFHYLANQLFGELIAIIDTVLKRIICDQKWTEIQKNIQALLDYFTSGFI